MATEKEIFEMLTILSATFPEWQKSFPEEQVKRTFQAYVQFLTDLPVESLREGIARYTQTQKYFPKICEIREAAFAVMREASVRPALPMPTYVAIKEPPELSQETKDYLQRLITRRPRHLHEEKGDYPEMTEEQIVERRKVLKAQAALIIAREKEEKEREEH